MKCHGVIRLRYSDARQAELYTRTNRFFGSFLEHKKNEILEYCDALDSGIHHMDTKKGFFLYAVKFQYGYCAILLDVKLNLDDLHSEDESKRQQTINNFKALRALYTNLILREDVSLIDVYDNPKTYFEDTKVAATLARLQEVKDVMLDNIDLMIERGGRIEDLVDATEELDATAFVFKHSSEELNSCWGLPPGPINDAALAVYDAAEWTAGTAASWAAWGMGKAAGWYINQ